ncbi:acetolactate synthase large subunit [Sneathiella chungangensis]|uniref:Acetolactate synthase large subunit n=1 Tax=Sneathiella chungangensis TaxID=1418234 RepID=A0A845MA93_9PROT|nr:acetolactate synthase large subunit [Sneathiella chungangensis]MZR20922.1 acetolactate synthase large subunit [Sneathiella chungangensis]
MNGADLVVKTLADCGVDLCFANPGTSEMHFLAALDQRADIRPVLALQENIATGAADGYGRLAGKPAVTLLHLGPGLANGLSNLHNAARALTPIVNVVGDHATTHRALDAPLTSDIEALSRTVSVSTLTVPVKTGVANATHTAVKAALGPKPGVSTLLLPADAAWSEADSSAQISSNFINSNFQHSSASLDEAVRILRQPNSVLLLGHHAVRGKALEIAGQISDKTGTRLIAQTTNPVIDRGIGRVPITRLPFPIEAALATLQNVPAMVLLGAKAPVAFFAYPGKPGRLTPNDCKIVDFCPPAGDAIASLAALADAVDAYGVASHTTKAGDRPVLTGLLDAGAVGHILATLLPEGAVIVDEAITNSVPIAAATATAAPHEWLQNMGGSIGYGAPAATGCAFARPDRPIVTLIGDGSAMYTLQALWTQARENLHVITIILVNRTYKILQLEAEKLVTRTQGNAIQKTLNIDSPELNFVKMAEGMGVAAERVETIKAFQKTLESAFRNPGPTLIEVML